MLAFGKEYIKLDLFSYVLHLLISFSLVSFSLTAWLIQAVSSSQGDFPLLQSALMLQWSLSKEVYFTHWLPDIGSWDKSY